MAVVTFHRVAPKNSSCAQRVKRVDVAFWEISLTNTTQCDTALRWLALTAQQDSDGFDSYEWELASLKWLQVCVPMLIFDFLFWGGLR